MPISGVDGQFHCLCHFPWSRLQSEHDRSNPPALRTSQRFTLKWRLTQRISEEGGHGVSEHQNEGRCQSQKGLTHNLSCHSLTYLGKSLWVLLVPANNGAGRWASWMNRVIKKWRRNPSSNWERSRLDSTSTRQDQKSKGKSEQERTHTERLHHQWTISPNPQERCGFHQECGSSENAHCERGCSSKRRGRNRMKPGRAHNTAHWAFPKGFVAHKAPAQSTLCFVVTVLAWRAAHLEGPKANEESISSQETNRQEIRREEKMWKQEQTSNKDRTEINKARG